MRLVNNGERAVYVTWEGQRIQNCQLLKFVGRPKRKATITVMVMMLVLRRKEKQIPKV